MARFVPYIAPFTQLHDIKPYKRSWRIQVKILHVWEKYVSNTGDTTEMILADMLGTLIHAIIKKEHFQKFQRMVVVGEWVIIHHFALIKATGVFRPTRHFCKMAFMTNTSVIESPNISNDIYLDLESYEDIADINALNDNILIDVIGQVVIFGEKVTENAANMVTTKLDIELRDTNDNRLGCTLWGKYADTMWDACQNAGKNIVICILRWAKIRTYAGQRKVSSALDISKLYINPEFPEALTFCGNLKKDGLVIKMKKHVAVNNGDFGDGEDQSG